MPQSHDSPSSNTPLPQVFEGGTTDDPPVPIEPPVPVAPPVLAATSMFAVPPVPVAPPVLAATSMFAVPPVPATPPVLVGPSMFAVPPVPVTPPVLAATSMFAVPPVPPAAPDTPASSVGDAQTQVPNVPAELHVCAPCWPDGHAQATLAPGMHLGPSLPPPQPPRNTTERNEARMQSLIVMRIIVAPFGFCCNLQNCPCRSRGKCQISRSATYYPRTSGVHFDGIDDPSVSRSPSVKPPGASRCHSTIST